MSGFSFVEQVHLKAAGITHAEDLPEDVAREIYGEILDEKILFNQNQQQAFDDCKDFPIVQEFIASYSVVYLHAGRNGWDAEEEMDTDLLEAANPEDADGCTWEQRWADFSDKLNQATLGPPIPEHQEESHLEIITTELGQWLYRHFPSRDIWGKYLTNNDYRWFIDDPQMEMVFIVLGQKAVPSQLQNEWDALNEITLQAMQSMIDYAKSFR